MPNRQQHPDASRAPIDVLDEAECWAALASTSIGRLALLGEEDIELFPVTFTVSDHGIFFRSTSGTKMIELTRNPRVTFEADGVDDDGRHWSVVVKGTATRLSSDEEIEASGARRLRPLAPLQAWNYVRITPNLVSGRRFEPDR